jgi:hypothetical protein
MKISSLRTFSLLTVVCFAVNFSPAHAADTNQPPRLTVELRDGSRVVGTSAEKNFKFHSALLGQIKLDVKNIRAVECASSNSAKLTTANGDSLTVSFVESKFGVNTSFGKVELAVETVRKFAVATPHALGARPSGLVALWSGEGNGDDSAGGNNGELHGNVSYAPGKAGQAFAFHNIGDGLTATTTDFPVGNSDRTIDCWIYIESYIPGAESFFAYYGNYSMAGQIFALAVENHASHRLIFSQGGGVVYGPTLDTGRWYNLAVTSAGNSVKLYVDGFNVATESLSFDTPPGSQFHIGSVTAPDGYLRQCIGLIDEVAVYNRALSIDEIQAICREDNHGELPPPPRNKSPILFNGMNRGGFSE